jgi:OOP family OmpA-OmpF porin
MNQHILIVAATAALLGATTSATANETSGWYIGAGAGPVTAKETESGLKGDDTAFKIFGGYEINEYMGLELSYIDAGKPEASVGSLYAQVDISALQAAIRPMLPLTKNFSVYAKAGLLRWDADVFIADSLYNASHSYSDDGNDFFWGGGLQFSAGRFMIRAEYEKADIESFDYELISGSLSYRF